MENLWTLARMLLESTSGCALSQRILVYIVFAIFMLYLVLVKLVNTTERRRRIRIIPPGHRLRPVGYCCQARRAQQTAAFMNSAMNPTMNPTMNPMMHPLMNFLSTPVPGVPNEQAPIAEERVAVVRGEEEEEEDAGEEEDVGEEEDAGDEEDAGEEDNDNEYDNTSLYEDDGEYVEYEEMEFE